MEREIIIARVVKKLSDDIDVTEFVNMIDRVYQKHKHTKFEDTSFPKELLQVVGNTMDERPLERKDKLEVLKKLKTKYYFNFNLNKNLESAWRLILKKWNLSSYRLEGGI